MALFEKGVSGNPAGRPKGLLTGRAKALYALDQVVSKEENIALIEAALEKVLDGSELINTADLARAALAAAREAGAL